jgi:hypothetical protein
MLQPNKRKRLDPKESDSAEGLDNAAVSIILEIQSHHTSQDSSAFIACHTTHEGRKLPSERTKSSPVYSALSHQHVQSDHVASHVTKSDKVPVSLNLDTSPQIMTKEPNKLLSQRGESPVDSRTTRDFLVQLSNSSGLFPAPASSISPTSVLAGCQFNERKLDSLY